MSEAPSLPKLPPLIALSPCLRDYAWGDAGFIPRALGLSSAPSPCAEAWFGAHPSGPAECLDTGAQLDDIVTGHCEALLGPAVHARFGALPYLLKLLAAARPLSIQVHPDADQAIAGFAAEEAAGIPRDAPHRNYRDASAKPELIVALTPFTALCGFRAPVDRAAQLAVLPELAPFLPGDGATTDAFRAQLDAWFHADAEARAEAVGRLLARLEREAPAPGTPGAWALAAQAALGPDAPPDPGVLFCFLLELVELAPGEGLFLEAGVPHAYLAGAGVEVMACSDNVLRGGLTPKHVDVDELLRVLRCDAGRPPILVPEPDGSGEGRYATRAAEFELHALDLSSGAVEGVAEGPETLLVLAADGPVQLVLTCEEDTRALAAGSACLIPHGRAWRLEGRGARVWRVRVPAAD